ncbi:hypothetical protein GCM10009702_04690 [Propioniferax innocua]
MRSTPAGIRFALNAAEVNPLSKQEWGMGSAALVNTQTPSSLSHWVIGRGESPRSFCALFASAMTFPS